MHLGNEKAQKSLCHLARMRTPKICVKYKYIIFYIYFIYIYINKIENSLVFIKSYGQTNRCKYQKCKTSKSETGMFKYC